MPTERQADRIAATVWDLSAAPVSETFTRTAIGDPGEKKTDSTMASPSPRSGTNSVSHLAIASVDSLPMDMPGHDNRRSCSVLCLSARLPSADKMHARAGAGTDWPSTIGFGIEFCEARSADASATE